MTIRATRGLRWTRSETCLGKSSLRSLWSLWWKMSAAPHPVRTIFSNEQYATQKAGVEAAAAELMAEGFEARVVLAQGDARKMILRATEERKPDLLVMARHSHQPDDGPLGFYCPPHRRAGRGVRSHDFRFGFGIPRAPCEMPDPHHPNPCFCIRDAGGPISQTEERPNASLGYLPLP